MEDYPGASAPTAPAVPATPPVQGTAIAPPSQSALDLMIQHAASQYNIPVDILRNLFTHESGMRSDLVGPKGELGIGQFMPATAKAFGIDPRDPAQAIPAAALFLRQNLNRFGGDMDSALAGYGWGPANVAKYGMTGAPDSVKKYVLQVRTGQGLNVPNRGGAGGGVGGAPAPGSGAPGLAPPTTSSTPLANAVTPSAPIPPAAQSLNPNLLAALGSGQANSLSDLFSNIAGNFQQQQAKAVGFT